MILVTGATGTVGRAAVDLLIKQAEDVVAVTRDPARAQLPGGAQVFLGDPSRPASLASVLPQTHAILLSPRAVGHAAVELLSLARDAGVERVVVLSALTVQYGGGEGRFADAFRVIEDIAKASGLAWTFLRCADFAANTKSWAPQIRASDVVRGAYGEAASSPIHERDIAAVATSALVDGAHEGHAYVLTGPQSLTQREKLRLIGKAIGADLSWQEISPDQARQAMLAHGFPAEIADRMLGYLADHLENAGPTTDTVEQLLARPALTFAQWATENAPVFRTSG
jgi:uncharacterized protein YbjT (DUF2867 family)